MTRLLVPDFGANLGWAFFQPGYAPLSGCEKVRGDYEDLGALMVNFEQIFATLIAAHKPTVIGYAAIFVGQKRYQWLNPATGRREWRDILIRPESIGPLFAMEAKANEMATRRRLDCVKESEMDARAAFLPKVPRKSKEQKEAVFEACVALNWTPVNHHASDALCMGDFIMSKLEPARAHESTPLFNQGTPADGRAMDRRKNRGIQRPVGAGA